MVLHNSGDPSKSLLLTEVVPRTFKGRSSGDQGSAVSLARMLSVRFRKHLLLLSRKLEIPFS